MCGPYSYRLLPFPFGGGCHRRGALWRRRAPRSFCCAVAASTLLRDRILRAATRMECRRLNLAIGSRPPGSLTLAPLMAGQLPTPLWRACSWLPTSPAFLLALRLLGAALTQYAPVYTCVCLCLRLLLSLSFFLCFLSKHAFTPSPTHPSRTPPSTGGAVATLVCACVCCSLRLSPLFLLPLLYSPFCLWCPLVSALFRLSFHCITLSLAPERGGGIASVHVSTRVRMVHVATDKHTLPTVLRCR